MAGSYPDLLAHGVEEAGRFDPFDLFAGSGPWHTTQMLVEDNQAINQFTPVALNTAGKVVPWVSGTTPALEAFGITAQPVEASNPGKFAPIFISGGFNHEALVWPIATDTLAERQAVFIRTPIYVQQIL
jgi:hypothetical protein